LLETLIFLELKKAGRVAYYTAGNGECDFLVQEGRRIVSAIQVCYRLDNENRTREIRGLIAALKRFRLSEGLLLTYEQEEEIDVAGKKILITPAWKWILESK